MTIPDPATFRYDPPEDVRRLRERALDPQRFFDWGRWLREFYYLESWMAGEGRPLAVRNADALANVIRNMPARLLSDELIVGDYGFNHGGVPLNFWPGPHGECHRAAIESAPLAPAQKRQLIEWLAAEPFAWQRMSSPGEWPPELRLACEHGAVEIWGTDLNHSVRAYEKVLRLGFDGLRGQVSAALASLDPAEPDAPRRRANLDGWLRICDAAASLGRRHAERACELAGKAADPAGRRRWEEIAKVCERVPAQPARTFREAVQSLWFAHMITAWEDGVNANSIGRLDQFLWPWLEADLAAGRVTWDEAADLLAALWIKLYHPYDVQQTMVGGTRPDGSDAVNPLSYMVLSVTEGLGFVRCLSARLHGRSPRPFVSRCVDLVARGGGIPFFFNDDTMVPALVAKGVPIEDARDYAAIGCIEITIPGRACPHAVSHWINVAKCLELALNDGRCLCHGAQVGPRTGTLADFRSMDDVRAAYARQLAHFARWAVYGSNLCELEHRARWRLPYLSILTDDCVARGLDIIEGGARYNYHSSAAMGIPNVADSLAALDLAVFSDDVAEPGAGSGTRPTTPVVGPVPSPGETTPGFCSSVSEKGITPNEMLDALRTNFQGREEMRLYLRNRLPKYGNDDDLPDRYAADLTRQYCEMFEDFRTPSGGKYFVHLFTFTLMLRHGKMTGASPDGRLAGEPLAYSVSPAQGMDKEGLTALLNSLAKLPHHMASASSSAIIEADPKLLEREGRDAFTDLIATAIRNGVGQMQINVVSADTLRAAQVDPDRYRNLCVRVSGFSQQFCLLDRELQDHIIARTKHER